jgi:CBS domain-containing protein
MSPTIGMLASRPVISIDIDAPVIEAFQLMSAQRISCIVVLFKREPVGILTERDVVFAANWVISDPTLRMREVMSKPVLAVSGETTLDEAYQIFRDQKIRHLVVLGQDLEMAGVFTQTNLVQALAGELFAQVRDVTSLMSSKVWQLPPQAPVRQALALMAAHAISGVVVVEEQRPVGIFTERDAVGLIAAGADLANLSLAAVMSAPVLTTLASVAPRKAFDQMRDHAVRRLVVVNERGYPAGVLTQTDLSRVLDRREFAAPRELFAGVSSRSEIHPPTC